MCVPACPRALTSTILRLADYNVAAARAARMNLRLTAALASVTVLAAALTAFYFWGEASALVVVAAVAASLFAARQFAAAAARAREAARESVHLSTAPNVATAVAEG